MNAKEKEEMIIVKPIQQKIKKEERTLSIPASGDKRINPDQMLHFERSASGVKDTQSSAEIEIKNIIKKDRDEYATPIADFD